MKVGDIKTSKWLNVANGFSLDQFKGKVIALHAFQMLCPGCVLHGIPQAQRLSAIFDEKHVSVIGLHTVFEHHEGMQEASLRAFIHEFRVAFPVGIDVAGDSDRIPKTMAHFQLQGTPSWLIFDRTGNLQVHVFGKIEDLALGSEITRLASIGLPSGASILGPSALK